MRILPVMLVPTALLSACASNPPVTISYHHPRADLVLNVAETIACDTTETPVTAVTVTSKAVYSADRDQPRTFAIKNLDGSLSNAEVTVTLSEDGRLTGLNTSQSGQGSEILQAAIAIGSVALGLANGSSDPAIHTSCEYIKNNGDKGIITVNLAKIDKFPKPASASGETLQAVDGDTTKYANVLAAAKAICYSRESHRPRGSS